MRSTLIKKYLVHLQYDSVLRNPTIKKLHLAELLANLKKVGRALTPSAPFSAKDMGRSHHTEIPPIEL